MGGESGGEKGVLSKEGALGFKGIISILGSGVEGLSYIDTT